MCVRTPPTFAPRPLRGAWGLVATQPSAGYPGAALLCQEIGMSEHVSA
jgi:hypothetical protein